MGKRIKTVKVMHGKITWVMVNTAQHYVQLSECLRINDQNLIGYPIFVIIATSNFAKNLFSTRFPSYKELTM